MADFRSILKVETYTVTHYSLKEIFYSLVDEPKRYPCGSSPRHYFLRFDSPSSARYALSHKRELTDVSVLPVHSCSELMHQFQKAMLLSSKVFEEHPFNGVTNPTRPENVSYNNAPLIDEVPLVSGPFKGKGGQLYAPFTPQDPSHDSVFSEQQGSKYKGSLGLTSTGQQESGVALLSTDTTYPLNCGSRISLALCGEVITYDLKSAPSNPNVIIKLLKTTKSERGNYMIASAFYRRIGHPTSAKAVMESFLEEFHEVKSESLNPAFLMLSGCELDMARIKKAVKKDASEHYEAAKFWLQKVFGKPTLYNVPAAQRENPQDAGSMKNVTDNRTCTRPPQSRPRVPSEEIARLEREIRSLRDRNSVQQKQLFNLRPLKRNLEDDFFYERNIRRKYQRRVEDLEKELEAAEKVKAHTLKKTGITENL